jgi:hypothetical protein
MGSNSHSCKVLYSIKLTLGCLLLSGALLFAQNTELRKDRKMVYPEYLISPNGKFTAELTEYGLSLCKRENDGSKTTLWKSHHDPFQDNNGLGELSVILLGTGDLRLNRNDDVIWHRPSNNRMVEDSDLRLRIDNNGNIVFEFYNNNVIWLQYAIINSKSPSDFNRPERRGGTRIKTLPIPPPFQW